MWSLWRYAAPGDDGRHGRRRGEAAYAASRPGSWSYIEARSLQIAVWRHVVTGTNSPSRSTRDPDTSR